jgi:hypothetical protein
MPDASSPQPPDLMVQPMTQEAYVTRHITPGLTPTFLATLAEIVRAQATGVGTARALEHLVQWCYVQVKQPCPALRPYLFVNNPDAHKEPADG